jgi:hypothetical protein
VEERLSHTARADDAPVRAAEQITAVLLGALRAVTLVLAGFGLAATPARGRLVAALLLAGLTGVSAVTFVRAGRRLAGEKPLAPFDAVTVGTETVSGVAALLILAAVIVPKERAGTSFWAEPYTVISAVIIAAAARRALAGALAAACLSGVYLLSVLTPVVGRPARGLTSHAAAYTNAVSYLAFFALAVMGFRLLRNIAGQAETLKQMIALLSAERTRFAAANRIWRIGHDMPKAFLRQVRRPMVPSETLRVVAPQVQAELLAALAADPRAPVVLREELRRIAATFTAWMDLEVDLAGLQEQPPGMPALLMAEAVRELLNNTSYHRYGYPARLTGVGSLKRAEVCVHNDGPGTDPQRMAAEWARKRGTIHQLETAGGSVQIQSTPAAPGTTVVLRYPAEGARGTTAP